MRFFRILGLTFFFVFFVSAIAAQDEEKIEDLFTNSGPDTVANPNDKVEVDPFTEKTVRFFGSMKSDSAYVFGFPGTQGTTDRTEQDIFFLMQIKGGIDLRPDPSTRILGSISTAIPQNLWLDSKMATIIQQNQTLTNLNTVSAVPVNVDQTISIDELFVDYNVKNIGFVRSGKFVLTWGQGRLFNPGNLTAGIEEGITVQAFLPIFGSVLTGLVNARWKYFQDSIEEISIGRFGSGGQFETTLGPLNFGISAFRQDSEGFTGESYIKSSFLGIDFFFEGLLYHREEDQYLPSFIGGLTWQVGPENWKIKVAGEYFYDRKVTPTEDHSIAFGLGTPPIPIVDTKIVVQWYHSLSDNSGQLVSALQNVTLPNLQIIIAVPFTYGEQTAKYVLLNSDPKKRWLGATLRLSLAVSF